MFSSSNVKSQIWQQNDRSNYVKAIFVRIRFCFVLFFPLTPWSSVYLFLCAFGISILCLSPLVWPLIGSIYCHVNIFLEIMKAEGWGGGGFVPCAFSPHGLIVGKLSFNSFPWTVPTMAEITKKNKNKVLLMQWNERARKSKTKAAWLVLHFENHICLICQQYIMWCKCNPLLGWTITSTIIDVIIFRLTPLNNLLIMMHNMISSTRCTQFGVQIFFDNRMPGQLTCTSTYFGP